MQSAVIWLLNANQVSAADRDRFLAYLSAAELLRYQRFLRPIRQREFLLGRVLLRFAVARQANIAIDAVHVVERKERAPLVRLSVACSVEPQFSLSHSRGWVACATSADTALGLDIEALDAERDVEAIGRSAFSMAESRWLSQRPADDKAAAFYALWVSKEALYKLISAKGGDAALPELVAGDMRVQSGAEWHARTWSRQGFAISLCSSRRLHSVEQVCLLGARPSAWSQQLRDGFF